MTCVHGRAAGACPECAPAPRAAHAEFTVVARPAPAPPSPSAPPPPPHAYAPAAPGLPGLDIPPEHARGAEDRPVGVTVAAALLVAGAASSLLGLAGYLLLYLLLDSVSGALGDAFAVLFGVLVALTLVVIPFELALAWGLWTGRPWARLVAIGLSGLSALGFVASAAADPEAFQPARLVLGLAPAALLAVLLQPGTAAWFARAEETRRHAPAGAAGATAAPSSGLAWALAWLLAAVGLLLAVTVATFPGQSLQGAADGATLAQDAFVGLAGGALLVGGATVALGLRRGHEAPLWVPLASGGAAAAAVALLLVASASAAARAPVVDGRATAGAGAGTLLGLLAFVALLAFGILLVQARDRRAVTLTFAAAAGLALGAAAILYAGWVLANLEPLQAAAVAREHRNTPGPGLLLALAAVAAAALLARRGRRRAP